MNAPSSLRLVTALVLLLVLGACGEAGEPDTAAGGVRLTALRAQVYGAVEGPGALARVFDVEVSPAGRVFASQPMVAEIAVFEPDGTFARTIGRRGEGPGEFRAPGAVRLRGDTLTVLDFTRGISLLGQEGEFFRRISFHLPAPPGSGFPTRPITLLADGTVGCFAPLAPALVTSGKVTRQSWVRATRDGELLDTLIVHSVEGRYMELELPRAGRRGTGHPAAWHDLVAIPPDGSFVIAVDRSAAAGGPEPVFRVHRIALSGDTVRSREFRYEPVPLTAEWKDTAVARMARVHAVGEGLAPERLAERIGPQVPWPAHHPAVSRVLAGADGTVWLEREPIPGDSVRWDLLDPELEPLGHTYLPASVDVKRVSRGAVWGVEEDELGVPRIVRFDVRGA